MGKLSRRTFIKGGVVTAFGLLAADAFWFEKYIMDWNLFDISREGQDPIKLIQLSDLHLQHLHYGHDSIANKINTRQPDLLVITGDAIDDKNNIKLLDKFLAKIDRPIPKIAILGNWEYWGHVDLEDLNRIYSKHNTSLLVNEHKSMTIRNRRVNIIGVDDYIGGKADIERSILNIDDADSNIILSHCPAYKRYIDESSDHLSFDFILSGHTHGGQINLLGYVPFKPIGSGEYLKGWYRSQGSPMYVSKGIGTSRVPIRLGSRAEVVEIHF